MYLHRLAVGIRRAVAGAAADRSIHAAAEVAVGRELDQTDLCSGCDDERRVPASDLGEILRSAERRVGNA